MTRNFRTLSSLALVLLAPLTARAADGTWAVDASGNWSNPANWSGGAVADGADSTANFVFPITFERTVTLDASRTIGNLTFSDTGGGASTNWYLSGIGQVLTVDRTDGNVPTITVNTQQATIISMTLAGNDGLHKAGAGDLLLSFPNTYSGGTRISGGRVLISSDFALGDAAGGITLDGGSLVLLNTNLTLSRPIMLAGSGGGIGSSPQLGIVASLISGDGGILTQAFGTVVFTNTNNYTGATTIGTCHLRAFDGIGLPIASNLVLGNWNTTEVGTFQ